MIAQSVARISKRTGHLKVYGRAYFCLISFISIYLTFFLSFILLVEFIYMYMYLDIDSYLLMHYLFFSILISYFYFGIFITMCEFHLEFHNQLWSNISRSVKPQPSLRLTRCSLYCIRLLNLKKKRYEKNCSVGIRTTIQINKNVAEFHHSYRPAIHQVIYLWLKILR